MGGNAKRFEVIAKLLHIANSEPPGQKVWKDRFYGIKNRILHRWGKRDGIDLQAFDGKRCWSCEGTGGLYEPCGCYKCDGTGWYRSPRIVQLNRWRLGRYVFHEPGLVVWREAKKNDKIAFRGYIEHANYSHRSVMIARILLGLLFDRGFAWESFKQFIGRTKLAYRIRALTTRRCDGCDRRVWSWKHWRCKTCKAKLQADLARQVEDDEERPF